MVKSWKVEKLLKTRFIHKPHENYPKDALHMYSKNEWTKRNDAILNAFPRELYSIEVDDKIPDNCKYSLPTIKAAQNQKQTNTWGLVKYLKLKVGAELI